MSRAPRLTPELRREALMAATLPLLREHGRAVTTRQIAEAAGVAEGTIFSVFDGKDDLIDKTLAAEFDLSPFEAALDALPAGLDLEGRLVGYVELLQRRLISIFGLMRSMGIVAPPESSRFHSPDRQRINAKAAAYVDPGAEVSVSTEELLHVLRLLTFSGSHYEIAHGNLLSPEQIVSVVLDGLRHPSAQPHAGVTTQTGESA